jgi:LacI family transcriptional regulator
MATIHDVSRLANVSISTVSRVLNNTAQVKESTRERIYVAMKQLGYQPNMFAQGLVTNRSRSITLVLTDLTGAYFGPLVKSLEHTLRKANYNLSISVENESLSEVQDTFRYLIGRRKDAVILFPHCLSEEQILQLREGAPPLVLLNRYMPEFSSQSITIDNVLGSRLAIEHLISRGHRNIVCITGPLRNSEAKDRMEGYRMTLAEHNIAYQECLVVESDFTTIGGFQAIVDILMRGVEFTAVYACNDQMAAGAIKALKQAGKKVPEDVSLIGFDDVEFASLLTPELTTIRQPSEAMGKAAAELALKLIQGETNLPKQKLFAPELIERNSVATIKI